MGRMGRQKELSVASNKAHAIARGLRSAKSLTSAQRRVAVTELTESARELVADLETITDER